LKVKSTIITNGLQTISSFSEKPMPVSLTAKLLRLTEDLVKENDIIEKQRQLIIEKYADKDEQGQLIINDGNVSFKEDDAMKKAQEELNELANLEIDIIDRGITEEDLINANLQLTINQLAILKNFIEEK